MLASVQIVDAQAASGAAPRAVRCVMVVDDSRVQRKILSSQLARSGLQVVEAGSAEEALDICRDRIPDLVISDWMMPGMTGIEFCQALREFNNQNYVYFILLTSKSEAAEIARGLDGGADDFLTKPVNGDELRARIAAGERILRMERELTDKNRLLSSTLTELQSLYDSLDRDLMEAKKLQQSLVRERHHDFGCAEVSLLLRPSGHVGGDLVGFFPIGAGRVGLFSIDVSGHGVASALMTARLAGFLSGSSPEQNLALMLTAAGGYDGREPAELALQLNRLVLKEMQTESYFTLAYADVDLTSGRVAMVQAGHPHPAVQRAGGTVEFLGQGGMPIGLIDAAVYDSFEVQLHPGDRLFLMSDGVTEAEDEGGAQLGEDGLAGLMARASAMRGSSFLEAIVWHLGEFAGAEFTDDVSGVFFEYHGPDRRSFIDAAPPSA
ncbi:Phosphate regulon transcriptional regulatory protein PhoB [Defluviimonas aquaemixtae]|uniref:Phosphate regulon transcriptional regulatory protein PhoB n=1 Tax=Albidovulum aquaemixtae TaxID=1542388 RepID=A0A2R8BJN7_9RHOB|nr:fused response regulator/phosphatase [Defluviimonas aquaemixtae]SPH23584.1 Phosphate regulon transcriptional regulatory protein PhoB [Defluviimonas aquaemixtae]